MCQIGNRVSQLKTDLIKTRNDPLIADRWRSLCRYHRKTRQKITGTLTEQDLLSKVFAAAVNRDELFVKKVMSVAPLATVDPENDIPDAVRIMNQNNVNHFPVTEKLNLVGMLQFQTFTRRICDSSRVAL